MKRFSKIFAVTAIPVAVAVFAFGGSNAGGNGSGAFDAYFKITVDQYQCGPEGDNPLNGVYALAIYGTGGAEWSYPDDTTFSTRIELLSPYPFVFLDEVTTDATGESGALVGVYAAFPVDPQGYPVILKYTSTTSVSGVATCQQVLTLTCTEEGPATEDETESVPTPTTIPAGSPTRRPA